MRDAAKFLDAPNGGRANLPMEVIVASSLAMLRDLNRAGLTASGGECEFEELHRQFRVKEGPACGSSASAPRPADAAPARSRSSSPHPDAQVSRRRRVERPRQLGRELAGGGGDDLYSMTPQPVPQAAWDQWGRFARRAWRRPASRRSSYADRRRHRGQAPPGREDRQGASIRPLRWAFMHMEGVTPAQIERMKKLNMFIAVHPREIVSGGFLHRVHGDKAFAMPPLREIQDSGIMWGLGTDAFEVNQYRPFQTLHWAVTGKMVGGTVVNTHTITREAALIAHTRSNAFLFFRENDLGSIQNGRLADLVVIDRDYLTIPADQIEQIKPVMTMVGGRVVFDAAAQQPTR